MAKKSSSPEPTRIISIDTYTSAPVDRRNEELTRALLERALSDLELITLELRLFQGQASPASVNSTFDRRCEEAVSNVARLASNLKVVYGAASVPSTRLERSHRH